MFVKRLPKSASYTKQLQTSRKINSNLIFSRNVFMHPKCHVPTRWYSKDVV